jgi:hypothetical protein
MAIGALIAAFFCSPLGIALGFVAKGQIKKTGQSARPRDGGHHLGVLSLLLGIALFASGMSSIDTAP